MLKQHARLVARFLYLADMAITALSFFIAYWIRSAYLVEWEMKRIYPIEQYYWLLLVIIPVWSVLFTYYKAYKSYRVVPLKNEFRTLCKVVFIGGIILGAIEFSMKTYYLSRALIIVFVAGNILLLSGERFVIRTLSRHVRRRGNNYRNVDIVGTDNSALNIASIIEEYKHWGLKILGFISDNPANTARMIEGYKIIWTLNEMEKIMNTNVVDKVIFAVPRGRFEQMEDIFLMLEENGINTAVVANFFCVLLQRHILKNWRTSSCLSLRQLQPIALHYLSIDYLTSWHLFSC